MNNGIILRPYMNVIKRNGQPEQVSFDKILKRIDVLCKQLKLDRINSFEITKETINELHDNITTEEIDNFSASYCSEKIKDDPQYNVLAAALCVSRLHKMTDSDFMKVTDTLFDIEMVTSKYYEHVKSNIDKINAVIDYNKDYDFDYFGIKTLEKGYLCKSYKNGKIGKVIERPQHLFMRVAFAINKCVDSALETYKYLSNRYFIFGSPTLYNAGTNNPQMSSCFY